MDGKGLWISAEVMADERLSNTDKILLAEIQNLTQLGECFAGNEHFAQLLGLSKTRITHLLTNLNRLNLIDINLTYKQGTKEIEKRTITPMVKNDYTPSQIQLDPMVKNDHTPMVKNDQDKKQVFKKQVKKQIKDKNIYEQEFETLWSFYPRKKGKDKALQAYIKARKEKTEYETVKIGLEMYIQYVQTQQTDEQYIKHGSTWFNQKSWQDDYTTVTKRPKGYFGLLYDQMDTDDIFEERREVNGQDRSNQNFDNLTELLPEPIQEHRGQNSFEPYSANVGEQFF